MLKSASANSRYAELACQAFEQGGLSGSWLGKNDDGTAGLNKFVFSYIKVANPQTSRDV